jgi:hypothetical protein
MFIITSPAKPHKSLSTRVTIVIITSVIMIYIYISHGKYVYLDCGPVNLPNGKVETSNGTTMGAIASAHCNQGYDLVGSSVLQCTEHGWNDTLSCQRQSMNNITLNVKTSLNVQGNKRSRTHRYLQTYQTYHAK